MPAAPASRARTAAVPLRTGILAGSSVAATEEQDAEGFAARHHFLILLFLRDGEIRTELHRQYGQGNCHRPDGDRPFPAR